MIAPLEAAHEINRPLNKSALSKSSAVYQISRGLTRRYPRHLRFRQKIKIFRVISGQISCSTCVKGNQRKPKQQKQKEK
jgi:hypothetical protein